MALTNKSSCFGAMMILGVVLALGLLVSNVSSSRLLTSSEQSVREMHEQWMSQYGRVYKDDAEKEERFKIFKQNLEFIESSNNNDAGCNGGTPDGAFEYVRSYGGIESEDAYPYTGSQGSCNAAANPIIASITGFQDVPANNEEALQQAVASQPVSVAIDASDPSFQSYSSGIYSGPCSTNLDHAVTVVGYGTDPNSGNPYWIVKNSWGTSWGQQGYIWMQMGLNPPYGVCGIAMQASYPTA
ncbi:hypothetical protein Dimus_032856 [Dionaea muscipula]